MIRVVDLETTDLPPDGEVVEAATVDIVRSPEGKPVVGDVWRSYVDPGLPIPPQACAIHHITDDMVAGAPEWAKARKGILAAPNVVAYCVYNAAFETSFIDFGKTPCIDMYKVALKLWPESPNHKNQTVRYFLKLDIPDWKTIGPAIKSREELSPHRAAGDAIVTAHIFIRALEKMTPTEMGSISRLPALLPRFHFGEHAGKSLDKVPWGYLKWIVDKSSFTDADVLFTAEHELNCRKANGKGE